jgi:predicted permease
LSKSPGFTVAAVTTIALGVGVNTGIFSVINGVLFRDLPASDSDELVAISQTIEGGPEREGNTFQGLFSTAEYRAYSDSSRTLSGILGYSDPVGAMLASEARQMGGLLVTCGYFDVLGAQVAIGRGLREQDCTTGADPVIVLSHEFWTATYAADPAIVGRTIELGRHLFTIVGIAPEGTYGGTFRAEFFAPMSAEPLLLPAERSYENDLAAWLHLVGRRADGVGIDAVRAELGVIAAQIDQGQPGRSTTLTFGRAKALALPPFVLGAAFAGSAVIMTAFGLILLIACANVANLLLARGAMRSREFAVRLALGASRARVIRELLVESTLLSVAGGVLGSLLAFWLFQTLLAIALPTFLPVGLPLIAFDASPDVRVLTVTLALTLGTGILFGLAPALQASKPDLHSVMKQDSPGSGSHRGGRLQATLVAAQVALCMVLMVGAGLLLRGLYAAHTVDPGFDYRDVTVLSYDYVEDTGHDDDAAFWERLRTEIGGLPGVEGVAYTMREPLGDDFVRIGVRLPGQAETEQRSAELNSVAPDYFSVIGLPLMLGRAFTEADRAAETRVAVVSESTARNLWPGADPIGQTFVWDGQRGDDVTLQVVGVVRDAQVRSLGQIDPYYVYLPGGRNEKLLVKSRADFATTATAIRGVVRALDPGLPVPVYPLEANVDRWQGISGVLTTLAAGLGVLALVLAAVGIFGVVAHFIGRRTREIGIRMALGAKARDVVGLILRRTLRPVAIGAAIGVAAAIAVSGILSNVLFGVSPVDAAGIGFAVAFVLGVGLVAGLLPARRAARVDPMAALHHE